MKLKAILAGVIAPVLACAVLLCLVACAAPAAGAGAKANVSLTGRWAGNFMANNGASGGAIRMVIDPDGKVRGSLTDTASTHADPKALPIVATLDGSVNGGVMKLKVTWSGGALTHYSGDCSNQGLGSLGANLKPASGSSATPMVLSMHEQGISGRPPYGIPASTVQPEFQRQWIGSWTVNWYDGGADYGNGTVRIAVDGSVDGALVDDAFNTTQWNQAVSALFKGMITPDGTMTAAISWSDKRPGWSIHGKAYFTGPESFQIELSPPKAGDDAATTITMTFHR